MENCQPRMFLFHFFFILSLFHPTLWKKKKKKKKNARETKLKNLCCGTAPHLLNENISSRCNWSSWRIKYSTNYKKKCIYKKKTERKNIYIYLLRWVYVCPHEAWLGVAWPLIDNEPSSTAEKAATEAVIIDWVSRLENDRAKARLRLTLKR